MQLKCLSYKALIVGAVMIVVLGLLYRSENLSGSRGVQDAVQEYNIKVKDSVGQFLKDELSYSGVTKASKVVKIQAETSGKVLRVIAKQGALVKAGDVIVDVEPGNAKTLLQKSSSALEKSKIRYKATLELYSRGLSSKFAIASAKSELKEAQAEFEYRQLEYEKKRIRAPFDGIIDTINVHQGDYLNVMNSSLIDCVSSILVIDPMKVVVEVPEHVVTKAKSAKFAKVILPNGESINGNITFLSSIANADVHSFTMEIEIKNPGYVLSGQTVDVLIPVGSVLVHCIPRSALVLDGTGGLAVKTIDDNNVVAIKPITIVKETNDCVFVNGLLEKEKVVMIWQGSVLEGQKILKYTYTIN